MFFDILKVGAISCFSPLQSVLTVAIFTHMLAQFGTEILAGYGVGARLEFMLTSIAFAVGIASVPMVGMAIGAQRVARARRIAWIAGCVAFASVGAVATVIAIYPDLWVNIFTDDPSVRAASRQYLSTAAPMYAFIGLSISMYFSSQGAAKVLGPVLAQTARLVFVAAGGWWLSTFDALRRIISRWRQPPWSCSACCPPPASSLRAGDRRAARCRIVVPLCRNARCEPTG